MKFLAVIQARMSSRRLPGKVLMPLHHKPLLQYVVETCQNLHMDVVVATSQEASDDPIEVWAHRFGVACYRGPLEDVLGRFKGVCEEYPSDVFFRVNADSPLINAELFESAMQAHETGGWDVVTNVFPRTFPAGVSIEALKTETFLNAESEITDGSDREHVVPYFYRHADRFRIFNIESGENWEGAHLAIDTAEDHERVTRVLEAAEAEGRPHWELSLTELSRITVPCP